MDMWVVAAAAGAGYLAKYWQNVLKDKDRSSELSIGVSGSEKPSIEQVHNKNCPLSRFAQGKKLGGDIFTEREKVSDANFSEMSQTDGASVSEVVCTGGFVGENLVNLGHNKDCNFLSVTSLPPGLLRNENLQENGDESRGNDDIGDNSIDLLPEPSIGEMGVFHGSSRKRSSLRSKRSYGHFLKPLSSLESCLMAQLYKEHAEMEEYVLSSLPSPSALIVRPLLVTDGNRITSQASSDYFGTRIRMEENNFHKETYSKEEETVFGVPPLPNIGSAELPRKVKLKAGKGRGGKVGSSSKTVNRKHFRSLGGSSDGTLLFCLGFSIGILSSVIANKREADKLKELLKHTENLVQDLQEELEMKDSLTVKELADENYESQDTHDHSFNNRASNDSSPQQYIVKKTKYYAKEPYDHEAEVNSESISKIEAELEAELERLELNMTSSSLRRDLSDLVEVDPDFVPDFVQDELRTDMVGGQVGELPDSDQDTSGTSSTHSANYAVSPRDLSLRLHEVIQSRLEERVKELETALENSQGKMHLMESEHMNSSNSELGSSSTHGSPIDIEQCNSIAQPLVINLSDEALDAYNEAYKELMKNELKEEDSTPGVVQNGRWVVPDCRIDEERASGKCILPQATTSEEHISSVVYRVNAFGVDGDENSDCDDEMERLLIKQIVEKTKKGSPVVLNAQRMLISMNENES